jgi:hypothetical protein
LERLQKEKPDAPMEDLVKEADEIVAQEINERQKQREADAAAEAAEAESANAKIEEKSEEVSSA